MYSTAVGSFETLSVILKWAKQNNAKVMLNPGGSELADTDRLKGILSDIEVLCLNKEEMQTLVEGDDLETSCDTDSTIVR